MEHKPTLWTSAMTYGLYMGAALIVFNLILYLTGQLFNTRLSWISYVIIVFGIYYFQSKYRDLQPGGNIRYGSALGLGVAMMFFTGIILMVYNFIIYKFDPSLGQTLVAIQEEAMIEKGMPEEQIEMMSGIMSFMLKPAGIAFSTLFNIVFMGFIISLVTSAFIKRDNNRDAFGEAMKGIEE